MLTTKKYSKFKKFNKLISTNVEINSVEILSLISQLSINSIIVGKTKELKNLSKITLKCVSKFKDSTNENLTYDVLNFSNILKINTYNIKVVWRYIFLHFYAIDFGSNFLFDFYIDSSFWLDDFTDFDFLVTLFFIFDLLTR